MSCNHELDNSGVDKMNQKKLYDYNLDEHMQLLVLIKSVTLRKAKNGKDFLAILFEDKSGQMEGMYWGVNEKQIKTFTSGKIVNLQAIRQVYQGKAQLKIIKLTPIEDNQTVKVTDFIMSAPVEPQAIEQEITEILFSITNPHWNRIVRYLLQKNHEAFYNFPAAKQNHHAFTGGLAYHTLSIVHLAQSVAKQYSQINEGLLLAGALLHDIGKTIELSGPIGTTYTLPGNLLGHIAIADAEIVLAAKELNIDYMHEDIVLLRHVVLAHHGLLEYGSPVQPEVLEAEVLHHLDELDARIQTITTVLTQTNPGEFSDRVYALDKRMVYKPKANNNMN